MADSRGPAAPATWRTARLIPPTAEAYVLAALASGRRRPIVNRWNARSREAAATLDSLLAGLAEEDGVLETVRLDAVLGAPGTPRDARAGIHTWDDALLVRVASRRRAEEIASGLRARIAERTSRRALVTAAGNARRIADVPHPSRGVYLLNFFTGPNVETTLSVWEHTAGWFQEETALANSTVLEPIDAGVPYTAINHCRWDHWTVVIAQLLTKRSFRTYVLRRFEEVGVRPHPILYRVRSSDAVAR